MISLNSELVLSDPLNNSSGSISIHVFGIRDIKSSSEYTPNPYLLFNLGHQDAHTPVISHTHNPTWFITIPMSIDPKVEKELSYRVMSAEKSVSKEMGKGEIKLTGGFELGNRWIYVENVVRVCGGIVKIAYVYIRNGGSSPQMLHIPHNSLKIGGQLSTTHLTGGIRGNIHLWIGELKYPPKQQIHSSYILNVLYNGLSIFTSTAQRPLDHLFNQEISINATFFDLKSEQYPVLEFQLDWVDDSFRSPLVGRVDLLDIRTQNITFRQMKAFDVVLTAQPPHDGSSNPLLNIKVAFQRYIPAVQVERDVPVEREEKGKLSTILIRKVVSEVLGELEYDQYLLAKGQNSSSYTINTRIIPPEDMKENVMYIIVNIPYGRKLPSSFGIPGIIEINYRIGEEIRCPKRYDSNPEFNCSLSVRIEYTRNSVVEDIIMKMWEIGGSEQLIGGYNISVEKLVERCGEWGINELVDGISGGYFHLQAACFHSSAPFIYPPQLFHPPFLNIAIVSARGVFHSHTGGFIAKLYSAHNLLFQTQFKNTSLPIWNHHQCLEHQNITTLLKAKLRVEVEKGGEVVSRAKIAGRELVEKKGKWAINGMLTLFTEQGEKNGQLYIQIGLFSKEDLIPTLLIQKPLLRSIAPKLTSGIYNGTILIYLVSGRGLMNTQKIAPMVEAWIGKQKVAKSKTQKGRNPEFMEIMRIPYHCDLIQEIPPLKLKIFNSNLLSNEFMGKIELNIRELISEVNKVVWDWMYDVMDPYHKSGIEKPVSGHLHIRGGFSGGEVGRIMNAYESVLMEELKAPRDEKSPISPISEISPDVKGVLYVKVNRGYDLKKGDSSSSDAYVLLKLGKKKLAKSEYITSINPNWDYFKEFVIDSPLSRIPQLGIHILDKDTLTRDDFLGQVSLNLEDSFTMPGYYTQGFYPLVDNKGRAGEERPAKGFIHAQIVFLPQPLQQAAAPQFEPLEEGGEVLRGRFLVTVFGANGIRSGDDHNSDAYCKIKWAGELMRKTKVVTSLNPEWNESIQFEAVFLHSKGGPQFDIAIELWDYDKWSNDDYLGEIKIQARELHKLGTLDSQSPLKDLRKLYGPKDPVTGTIKFRMIYYN